jgi:hypothetical protein
MARGSIRNLSTTGLFCTLYCKTNTGLCRLFVSGDFVVFGDYFHLLALNSISATMQPNWIKDPQSTRHVFFSLRRNALESSGCVHAMAILA